MLSAMSGVTLWMRAPSQGRRTTLAPVAGGLDHRLDHAHGDREADADAAADCEKIAVLMPTSWPRRSTSAPPELPGLIAASVWMKFS